jgi:Xaa-Pro aminopeptidase
MKFFGHYALDAGFVKEKYRIEETYYAPFGENPGPYIAKVIKALGPKKIGLCGTRNLGASVYRALIENLEEIEVEEATDIIDNLRMVKSHEELKYIKKVAAVADFAMDYVRSTLTPGKVECDLINEVDYEVKKRGVEDSFYFIGSGKVPSIVYPAFTATRRIEAGDLVIFNSELAGEEGYCTQCVRFYSLGKPGEEVSEAYEILKAAFEAGRNNLRQGNRICDVANGMLNVVQGAGYTMALHMGHGQGLDMMERPFPTPDDGTELKTNMTITLHPQVVLRNGINIFVANQYIVTEQGGNCLHKTPNVVIVV